MSQLHRLVALAISSLLLLSACAGSEPLSPQAAAAIEAATVNASLLLLTDDFTTTEMLDTKTGEIVSLDNIITGDRPVLLWYWAPN